VRYIGFPVSSVEPTDQLLNSNAALSSTNAVRVTGVVPASYQVRLGERSICPPFTGHAGVTEVVNLYCVCQVQVTEESAVIVKDMLVPEPLVIFPVPECPVQMYLVSVTPSG
jgi:hypothetical protein